jgi:hypothetical protein
LYRTEKNHIERKDKDINPIEFYKMKDGNKNMFSRNFISMLCRKITKSLFQNVKKKEIKTMTDNMTH